MYINSMNPSRFLGVDVDIINMYFEKITHQTLFNEKILSDAEIDTTILH